MSARVEVVCLGRCEASSGGGIGSLDGATTSRRQLWKGQIKVPNSVVGSAGSRKVSASTPRAGRRRQICCCARHTENGGKRNSSLSRNLSLFLELVMVGGGLPGGFQLPTPSGPVLTGEAGSKKWGLRSLWVQVHVSFSMLRENRGSSARYEFAVLRNPTSFSVTTMPSNALTAKAVCPFSSSVPHPPLSCSVAVSGNV